MKAFGKVLLSLASCFILTIGLNNSAFAKKKSHAHHYNHHAATFAPVYGPASLTTEINRLVANVSPGLNVGIQIKSMKYDDMLYSRNSQQLYTPASILKIFTAEAALLYLGPSYKFPTVFVTDARTMNGGVLEGNLYLVHSGDPSLTLIDLMDLMATLRARQIQQISGNIYLDMSAYDQEMYGPGWISNDTRFCYAAPISASIINHNCMIMRRMSSVVTDVIHYNKSLIHNLFQRYGIQINGDILPGTAPTNLPVLASHESKPLKDLISEMLKKSDNVIAGSLFKKMGELYTREPGSWQNGSRAVTQILQERAGLDPWRMHIMDGSGLSRENQISPDQMMQVLDFAYHNTATNYDFISALPIAGIDGTLKHRMKNIAWKVRAKTGTMSGVVALAGYAISKDKEPLAFVIIINGRLGMGWRYKEMENQIMTALTHYSRG